MALSDHAWFPFFLVYCLQKLELEKFITHEVSFANINKAFDYMLKGESIRCVINVIDN
jgi:alcohol dehydrogenase class-P